jgi:hypothetical protein
VADVGSAIALETRRVLPTCAVALDGRVVLRNAVPRLPWSVVRQSSHAITCQLPDGALVHVFADSRPGPDFSPVEPDLEDVYFSVMAGHQRARAGALDNPTLLEAVGR